MNQTTILIGADLVPTKTNMDLFIRGDIEALVGRKMLKLLTSVDCRIFNLECPITDIFKPIVKCGPNLIAPVSAFNGIRVLNPTVLGLANNHILDQDEQGLLSTMKLLNKHNIAYVGAGSNLDDASKSYILVINEMHIGVYACAEHEFTIAQENQAGANPFDPLESLDHIGKLKTKCDYVIILYHGGKEHYRYPSPYLQKVCRKMVEKGADLVVCQHSHCIGAFEEYMGSSIVYGQGNFIFDASNDDCWQTSLLLKLTFESKMRVEFIPICKKGNVVELADEIKQQEILDSFSLRSKQIKDSNFVENEYEKFCTSMGEYYLRKFAGYSRIMSKVDRVLQGLFIKHKYNENQRTVIRNFIECEAHRELVLKYLTRGQGN